MAEARTIVDRCVDPGIAGRLLARTESRHRVGIVPTPPDTGLVEQLTERELAVLRYLPTQMSLREIAAELFVSLNTVKTHSSAIYRKLARQPTARARSKPPAACTSSDRPVAAGAGVRRPGCGGRCTIARSNGATITAPSDVHAPLRCPHLRSDHHRSRGPL